MNVLSLFDGMSCGMLALDRLGIKVDKYYASEIDKYAMQVSQANYPDIIQVGDITKLDLSTLPKIDLVMGGSPCQGFSFAGKQLAFDDPRSALFFEFHKAISYLQPKYFLLENVRMKKEYLDIISEYMGVKPIFINSSLVSAQSRQRYYWTNIPNVEQPKERGIVLKDILEDGFNTERDKSHCLDANYYKGSSVENYFKKSRRQMVFKDSESNDMVLAPQKLVDDTNDLPEKSQTIKSQYYKSSKANFERIGTFHATGIPQKLVDVRAMTEVRTPEANQIRYEHKRKTGKDWSPRHMRHLVERPDEKMNTLTSALTKQHILQITEEQKVYWRKLTPIECERLQTVPDNYTNHVSNTQRYKMLGNGWTIEVIAHILQNMEIEQ
jgi:DNA (cytosine-5)-methyltransferase 3A